MDLFFDIFGEFKVMLSNSHSLERLHCVTWSQNNCGHLWQCLNTDSSSSLALERAGARRVACSPSSELRCPHSPPSFSALHSSSSLLLLFAFFPVPFSFPFSFLFHILYFYFSYFSFFLYYREVERCLFFREVVLLNRKKPLDCIKLCA